MNISVIICTHNPRPDFLRRTLESLELQTLPRDRWELLLIDNASNPESAPKADLRWHPQARQILEEQLGLVNALLRGIADSKGELLVFVHDDNILVPNYLERALQIAQTHPFLGVWCGAVLPEFETPAPAWITPYLSYLALRDVTSDNWSNRVLPFDLHPVGAGLCARRKVALYYSELVKSSQLRTHLSRKGTGLSSHEDTDLSLCALDCGYGTGLMKDLVLTHIIPERRITVEYMERLIEGCAYSDQILRHCRGLKTRPVPMGARRLLGIYKRKLTMSDPDRRFFEATQRGRKKALQVLSEALATT